MCAFVIVTIWQPPSKLFEELKANNSGPISKPYNVVGDNIICKGVIVIKCYSTLSVAKPKFNTNYVSYVASTMLCVSFLDQVMCLLPRRICR